MSKFFTSHNKVFNIITIGTIFSFVIAFLLPYEALAQQKVQIPVGTSVLLKTNTTLTPEQLNVGDTVELTVVSDVVVDGNVVIKAGAPAKGEIVSSKNRGMIGIAAKIGLTLRSVEAVDGTTVALSGSKLVEGKDKMVMSIGLALVCCILFALMKGGEAVIPAGTQIESSVAATVAVTVQ